MTEPNPRACGPAGIYLAGFMGSGKSTVGRLLADELAWPFVDLDEEIERREGTAISEIFADKGESGFRKAEHEALLEQAALVRTGNRRVVALGGGTFAFARNREALREAGLTLWLDAGSNVLWGRVCGATHRPLARDRAAFDKLHAARRQSYARADERIDAAVDPASVVASILALVSIKGR